MTTFRDDYRFDDFFFFKDQLEKQLGISLSKDDLNNIHGNCNSNLLHAELEPYKSRITINSWEAASLIVNNHPDADSSDLTVHRYKDTILNAVKNDVLASKELHYDINNELCYAEIYTKDIGLWAKKHNYNWPLPINDEVEETNQDNNELLNRIKQLEQELQAQKNNSESVYIPPLNIVDTSNLERENNQLKIDNQNITEQLNDTKKEIEELKKQVPILLGEHRDDDLLLLAVQTRNNIWNGYTSNNPNYKPLSSTQIKSKIRKQFNHLSERELSSIELVACPIKRGN